MDSEELTKNADIERIAKEGALIYQEIKAQYEPSHHGEFLAIEIESKKAYLAPTSAEAVVSARKENPEKVFYVVKVGFNAAEMMAHLFTKK